MTSHQDFRPGWAPFPPGGPASGNVSTVARAPAGISSHVGMIAPQPLGEVVKRHDGVDLVEVRSRPAKGLS